MKQNKDTDIVVDTAKYLFGQFIAKSSSNHKANSVKASSLINVEGVQIQTSKTKIQNEQYFKRKGDNRSSTSSGQKKEQLPDTGINKWQIVQKQQYFVKLKSQRSTNSVNPQKFISRMSQFEKQKEQKLQQQRRKKLYGVISHTNFKPTIQKKLQPHQFKNIQKTITSQIAKHSQLTKQKPITYKQLYYRKYGNKTKVQTKYVKDYSQLLKESIAKFNIKLKQFKIDSDSTIKKETDQIYEGEQTVYEGEQTIDEKKENIIEEERIMMQEKISIIKDVKTDEQLQGQEQRHESQYEMDKYSINSEYDEESKQQQYKDMSEQLTKHHMNQFQQISHIIDEPLNDQMDNSHLLEVVNSIKSQDQPTIQPTNLQQIKQQIKQIDEVPHKLLIQNLDELEQTESVTFEQAEIPIHIENTMNNQAQSVIEQNIVTMPAEDVITGKQMKTLENELMQQFLMPMIKQIISDEQDNQSPKQSITAQNQELSATQPQFQDIFINQQLSMNTTINNLHYQQIEHPHTLYQNTIPQQYYEYPNNHLNQQQYQPQESIDQGAVKQTITDNNGNIIEHIYVNIKNLGYCNIIIIPEQDEEESIASIK